MMTYPQQQQPGPQWQPPAGYGYYYPPAQRPGSPPARFGALAWTSLILGIVGVIGSPIIFLNNLTAVVAAVGVVLGVIALFGTRKVLAAIGVALCVAGIAFTVAAQGAAVEELDEAFGGSSPDTMGDASVQGCEVVDEGYGLVSAQAIVTITNNTDEAQSYFVTISVDDDTGARVGEILASSTALGPDQSTTLSGMDASGFVNENVEPGPVDCQVASVDRYPF